MTESEPSSHLSEAQRERIKTELGKAWLPASEELGRLKKVYNNNEQYILTEGMKQIRNLTPLFRHPVQNEQLMTRLREKNPQAAVIFTKQAEGLIKKTHQAWALWEEEGLVPDILSNP